MRLLILLILVAGLVSCSKDAGIKAGPWRGIIQLQGQELPFNLELFKEGDEYKAFVKNGEEKILLDEIKVTGDSVKITMHIFDIDLRARIDGDKLTGWYVKNYERDYRLPFEANFGETFRFTESSGNDPAVNFEGKFAVTFIHDQKDTTLGVALIDQNGDKATGTFLTPLGDYRFLEGNVVDGKLMLSTFDGNHAFLFYATKQGDSLLGEFYSGKSWFERWTGVRTESASLPHPESLTYLKEGYEKLDFSFPDLNGNPVSNTDSRFQNKVVILQLFGSWCPNCMDETKFLSEWYKQNRQRGVEILGLAYERKADFEYAAGRVNKMKDKLGVEYHFAIAGTYEKEEASKTLPALNRVVAFPTMIFVGKDGKVKHIHTGFEGPGTGIYYERFKERFNQIINECLAEPPV